MKALTRFLFRDRKLRIHLLLKGRIGEGWHDVDRWLKVPQGTTLGQLVEITEKRSIPLGEVIEKSPHLRHTLMRNGERCDFDENRELELEDGDRIYLLAPIVGG